KEIDRHVPYQAVHAHQSKRLRMQDASILAETGKLHFVGRHDLLEDQLCTWVEGEKTPDRADAFAHAVRELVRSGGGGGGDSESRAVAYRDPRPGRTGEAVPWEGMPVGGLWAPERRVVRPRPRFDPHEFAWPG